MSDLTNYKISFTHQGLEKTLYISAKNCCEAHKWRYIADSLGVTYRHYDGHLMLSHTIRNLVEEKGVSEVKLQVMATPVGH